MGPVAAFCSELAELQRRSGRSHASLAHELNISRGHLYTILKGEVKRPPDWNRVVEPFVRACGADREEIAQWRKRHDVLVQVVEQLRRERRRDGQMSDESDSAVQEDELGADGPDERPPPARDYAPRGRRRLIIAGALVLILIAALAGAAIWYFGRDDEARPDAGPCFSDAPPAGSDLIEVPHYQEGGEDKFINDWWSSDSRAGLRTVSVHDWEATVRGGSANKYDLIVLRSCVPLVGGRDYKLSLTASADPEAAILIKVQEPMGVNTSANEVVRIGPQPRRLELAVHGARTSRNGEVTFQLGGIPQDYRIKVTDVTLVG